MKKFTQHNSHLMLTTMKNCNSTGLLVALTTAISFSFSACSSDDSSNKSEGTTNSLSEENKPFGETSAQNLPESQTVKGQAFNFSRTAVRNFEQLKSSIAAVTCISDSDKLSGNDAKTFGQFFSDLSGNLPTTNDPEKYIAANIVGTMNLASQACALSVSLSKAGRCEWSAGLRSAVDPSEAFSNENIEALGKAVVQHFWGVDPSYIDNNSQFLEDLKKDVAELQTTVKQNLVATNVPANLHNRKIVEGVLISVCSAALSSSQFTTY